MDAETKHLPEDSDQLKALCLKLMGEVDWLKQDVEKLEAMLRLLRHQQFASGSESMNREAMKNLFPDYVSDDPDAEEEAEKKKITYERGPRKKKPFPDHLPREDVKVDIPDSEKKCSCGCQDDLKEVTETVTEKLKVTPATYTVVRYHRPVYSCKKCESMKAAPMPPHPLPKCSVTVESLANIAVSKCLDGLPLYRQDEIFKRSGFELGRDKMARWMIKVGLALEPIFLQMHKILLCHDLISMDETRLQVLKEKGRSATSKSWVIVQARGDPNRRAIVLYHYNPSRSSNVMNGLLTGFRGKLMTDGLAVYDSLCNATSSIDQVGCWAHARRRFVDAQKSSKPNSRKGTLASHAVIEIDKLYEIERKIKDFPDDAILAARQQKARPIVEKLGEWLERKKNSVPKSSKVGNGIHYALGRWEKLIKYLDDPKVPLDNNFVENRIRPFAVGRRNWLFSDTPEGAYSSMTLYSLLVTAKINDINPVEYLTGALIGMAKGESPDLHLPLVN